MGSVMPKSILYPISLSVNVTRKKSSWDPKIPISSWNEKETLDGKEVVSRTIILMTRGCSWARKLGCSMCGYTNDSIDVDLSLEDLMNQVDEGLKGGDHYEYIKIFTSGSFLDDREIENGIALKMISYLDEKAPDARILIESRPEYVDENLIGGLKDRHSNIEIAIGLEDGDDAVRSQLIRKGFTYEQYREAGRLLKREGVHIKTYLLLKPPFLGEGDSIEKTLLSIEKVHNDFPGSTISVNPMNIQSNTPVENMYIRGIYRPPWLWSLLEVLGRGHDLTAGETRLMSSPTAGGKKRGAHNCGNCDKEILNAINEYSLKGSKEVLETDIDCCKENWIAHLRGSRFDPTL